MDKDIRKANTVAQSFTHHICIALLRREHTRFDDALVMLEINLDSLS